MLSLFSSCYAHIVMPASSSRSHASNSRDSKRAALGLSKDLPRYNDRDDLAKLLRVCEINIISQPAEVRRLLSELTVRIENTGDGFLQTKLLLLKTQAELALGETDAAILQLRGAILTLNACETAVEIESELLAKIEHPQMGKYSDWESFRHAFEHAHPHFLLTLSSQCPSLTPSELKVCAMIRASLSAKEMIEITKTTMRNIENHRFKIRRKLDLKPQHNLATYLLCV
jgi:DNA-binding CsgD family transcriptional regulator